MRFLIFVLLVFISLNSNAQLNTDSLERVLHQPGLIQNESHILNQLADCYKVNDPLRSEEFANKALTLARINNDDKEIVDALNILAKHSQDYFKSIVYLREAESIAHKMNYLKGEVNSLNGQGVAYFYLGQYEKALSYYQKTLDIAKKIDYPEGLFMVLNNLGIINGVFKNYDSALKYLFEALNVSTKIKDKLPIANTYNNIGSIYLQLGDYKNSLKYQNSSLKIKQELNSKNGIAASLNNIGAIYWELRNIEQAKVNFKAAYDSSAQNNDKRGMVYSSINLAMLYMNTDLPHEAFVILDNGRKIAEEIDAKSYLKEIYYQLSVIYENNSDLRNALNYSRKYAELKDSVFSSESHRMVMEIQAKYEVEKKDRDIEFLQQNAKTQSRIKFLLIISCVALSIIGLLIWVSFKRRNLLLSKENKIKEMAFEKMDLEQREREAENARLQEEMFANEEINKLQQEQYLKELEHKNRELSTSTLNILNKNEILLKIKDTIQKTSTDKTQSASSMYKNLLRLIDQNINMEGDWDNFRIHFEEVHKGFFENLLSVSSELTNNDLRLCAYICINLNTKEIAGILNISPNSVDQRRYRLRKKLNMTSDENLIDFINKY